MSTFGFTDDVTGWDEAKVSSWTKTLGVRSYDEIIKRESINGCELVRYNVDELVEVGIAKRDAEKIAAAVATLNFARQEPASESNVFLVPPLRMPQGRVGLSAPSPAIPALSPRVSLSSVRQGVCMSPNPMAPPVVSVNSAKLLKGKTAMHYAAGDHHCWGTLHQDGAVPGTHDEWVGWYKTLDRLSADFGMWRDFLEGADIRRDQSDTFAWGDIKVSISQNQQNSHIRQAKQANDMSSLDAQYDLTPDRLVQLFSRFDKDEDGFIALHEVGALLRHQGLGKLDSQLKKIFKAVDLNNDMRLFLPEMAVMLCSLKLAELVLHTDHSEMGSGMTVYDFSTEEVYVNEVDDPEDFERFWFGHRSEGLKRWIHIQHPTKLLLLHLTVKYKLHPLGVEDAIDFVDEQDVPIKFDRFGNHFFVCLTYFFLTTTTPRIRYHTASLVMFVAGEPKFDTVISLIHSNLPQPLRRNPKTNAIETVWSGIQENLKSHHARTREHKSDYLMYELLAVCYEELKPITVAYRNRLSSLHTELMKTKCAFPSERLEELSSIVLELGDLHRNLRPMKHLLRQLLDDPSISKYTKMCLGNLFNDTDQVEHDIQLLREMCKTISDDYNRFNEIRLNDALGVLTVASAVFMPAQFLSGVYGMNFAEMPELKWKYGYLVFWAVLVIYFIFGGWYAIDRFGNIIQSKSKSSFALHREESDEGDDNPSWDGLSTMSCRNKNNPLRNKQKAFLQVDADGRLSVASGNSADCLHASSSCPSLYSSPSRRGFKPGQRGSDGSDMRFEGEKESASENSST